MIAVHRSYLFLSKYLLLSGANPNIQSNDGVTALSLACMHGFTHHVRILIASQADPNIPNYVILLHIFKCYVTFSQNGRVPLMMAIIGGQTEIINAFESRQYRVKTVILLLESTVILSGRKLLFH